MTKPTDYPTATFDLQDLEQYGLAYVDDWVPLVTDPARMALVPLPPGWRLDRTVCPTCHGKGDVSRALDGEATFGPRIPCPTCRGAGGWPTLMRPCDTCKDEELPGFCVDPDDIRNGVPCPAGCVDGWTPVPGTVPGA